jgi:hypothetical protein
MPIPVICPACKSRFQVSEQYAGKQGPCPKCKSVITIPKLEEQVVIHAPEEFSGGSTTVKKDKKGRSVLKPIAREKVRINPMIAIISLAIVVTTVAVAFLFRGVAKEPSGILLLGIGAAVLSLPITYAGYAVLRNRELEPYRGKQLLLRLLIVAAVYSLLWAAVWGIKTWRVPAGTEIQIIHMVIALAPCLLIGTLTTLGALEMEFTPALMHCSFYFVITCGLRLMMGLPPV